MVETKKQKKGSIGEEDISTLLPRYSVKTVLTLLQEVAKVSGEKIDWNAIVKNTATGISSPRELQMLWRHLAYGQTLNDQFDNAANPMEDDSDLEYELEAFPAVSRETSVEAAACVKVLIASDYPIDSHLPNNSTIEAPLTINIPKGKASIAPSDRPVLGNAIQGMNISIPVSVQKQPLSSGTCGEKRPNNGTLGVNLPPRRKRRGWSTEDDVKLTAAVEKYGEGNWANMEREDFMNDRKASELSQRWSNLRKKQGNLNVGTSSQLSEAKLAAAHQAMFLALKTPMGDNLKAARQMNTDGTKSQHQSQKASVSPSDQQLGIAGPPTSQAPAKWPSVNPTTSPDSMVKAAAVAAGARIASVADASSLIEAARSLNVVRIVTGGSSVTKSSTTSMTNQLPSNVHFTRNGPPKTPISSYSANLPSISRPGEAQQAQSHSIKPVELANAKSPIPSLEVAEIPKKASEMKKELVGRDQAKYSGSGAVEQLSENQSAPLSTQSKERVDENQLSTKGNALRGNTQGDQASSSFPDPISQTQDDRGALACPEVKENGKKSAATHFTSKEIHENPSPNGRHCDLLSTSLDGSGQASTRNTTTTAGDGKNK